MNADSINALGKVAELFLTNFGPGWTVVIVLIVCISLFLYRWYKDRRKDNETDAAIVVLNLAIQRLAADNRLYRVEQLLRDGWSEERVERFVMEAIPNDTIEARNLLESKTNNNSGGQTKQVKHQMKREAKRHDS